jgi:hypothetical protein
MSMAAELKMSAPIPNMTRNIADETIAKFPIFLCIRDCAGAQRCSSCFRKMYSTYKTVMRMPMNAAARFVKIPLQDTTTLARNKQTRASAQKGSMSGFHKKLGILNRALLVFFISPPLQGILLLRSRESQGVGFGFDKSQPHPKALVVEVFNLDENSQRDRASSMY